MTGRAYGQPPQSAGRPWRTTDKRYQSYKWRQLRKRVLARDRFRCWLLGCPRRADVCDHIDAVTVSTTDAEFFDERRLRASCRQHNLARALAVELDTLARFAPADAQPSAVITRSYTRRPPDAA